MFAWKPAGEKHIISWNLFLIQGQDIRSAFEAGMKWWGQDHLAPISNVIFVSGFANPDFLITVDAIAEVED